MDRAVESDRTAHDHLALGLFAGDLVVERRSRKLIKLSDAVNQPAISPTLDTLFQRTLMRHPHATALLDPLNKFRVTGHEPRRMSYAAADTAIAALSAYFVESGLP